MKRLTIFITDLWESHIYSSPHTEKYHLSEYMCKLYIYFLFFLPDVTGSTDCGKCKLVLISLK